MSAGQDQDQDRRNERNDSNKFRRRKINLMKKAFQLSEYCDARVSVVVEKNGRYYTFRSTEEESWPPGIKEIQRKCPLPEIRLPEHFRKRQSAVDLDAPVPAASSDSSTSFFFTPPVLTEPPTPKEDCTSQNG